MSAHCESCEAPLDSPLFSQCPSCEIKSFAARERERLEHEPWERLPEGWRRLAEGWADFPEAFQQELREFLIKTYEQGANRSLRRANGRRPLRPPSRPDIPLESFDDPVAEAWADANP